MTSTKIVLWVIAAVQLVLGIVFLVPGLFEQVMGLDAAPEWVNWMFAMLAARSLGFAFGMAVAARYPQRHPTWIVAMIGVQAVDWVATIAYLVTGAVTLAQVTTAAFLPIVFIAVLVRGLMMMSQGARTERSQVVRSQV
jgi:hypothetical protein